MDHVRAVMPTLIKLNSCATNLDMVGIHGVDPRVLRSFRDFQVVAGSYEAFQAETGSALVGRELMERRGWTVGDAVDINRINFTIRGVFEDGGTTYESLALVHLTFLQQATGIGRDSWATQLYVRVDDSEKLDSVAAQIDQVFDTDVFQTDTKPESAFLARGLEEFRDVAEFSQFLGYITALLTLILVANTIYMATQDRVKEIAILRTLGFMPERVLLLVVLESLTLSFIGGLLGAAGGYWIVNSGNYGVGIEGYQVAFVAEVHVFLFSFAVAILLGFLGGLLPAIAASRLQIVSGLRRVA